MPLNDKALANENYFKQLEQYLTNLNMQNISQANQNINGPQSQSFGVANDEIGNLIQQQQDSDALTRLMEGDTASANATASDGLSLPKTQGVLNSGLSNLFLPVANAQELGKTTVVQPNPLQAQTTTQPNTQNPVVEQLRPLTGSITPETVADYVKRYTYTEKGRTVAPSSEVTAAILRAAQKVGTSPDLLFRFANAESTFSPRAGNKGSGAKGLFQIIPGTWDYILDKLGGREDFQLKGNVHDPYENAVGAAIYLNEIKRNYAKVGRENNDYSVGEYYMGHFGGPGTGAKALRYIDSGKGNLPASEVFNKNQISRNKNIFYDGKRLRSLNEVKNVLDGRVALK